LSPTKLYPILAPALLLLLFLVLPLQANGQISSAFYASLPDTLKPEKLLQVSTHEAKKLMSSAFTVDAIYYPEIDRLAAAVTRQAGIEKNSRLKKDDYTAVCLYHFNQRSYDTALYFCNILLNLFKKDTSDFKAQLKISTLRGYILFTKNEYEKSIPILIENLKAYEQLHDSIGITNVSMRLASVYHTLEMISKKCRR
jgi:tetratricopeptide (TPR) repeat protein